MKKNKNNITKNLHCYIERELQPIKADKEAYYLSRKCYVSIDDAQEFLCARECYYTRNRSDAEYLMSDQLEEIADYLDYHPRLTMKKISSLLYHSNLYRCNRESGKGEYHRYFPTPASFMETVLQKAGENYDA